MMSNSDLVEILVMWAPTILFVLNVSAFTLIGMWRGYRKSLVLFIHSLLVLVFCLVLYFILVNVEAIDSFLLSFTNVFLGNNGLQNLLNVSESCSTMKEVLAEYIMSQMSGEQLVAMILEDNMGYLYALINFAYHIVFAVFMWIVYYLLIIILYFVQLIFYSTKKYKKKVTKLFANNLADGSYRKKEGRGALIGFTRGVVSSLIGLSLIGSVLYMSVGKGFGKLPDYNLGDPNANEVYTSFQHVEKYGTHGIYKVLNAVDNDDDVPLYLFAADLILQGKYVEKDEATGETTTYQLSLRSEVGAYTEFARDVACLLVKYGGEEIRNVVLYPDNENNFYVILDIFANPGFQDEFSLAIRKIRDTKYVINLAFSMINSVLANIEFDGVSNEVSELIQILFKKGFYSSYIPEEVALKKSGKELPYLSADKILNINDLDTVLRAFYLLINEEILTGKEFDPVDLVRQLVPYIEKLSLLSDKNKNAVNPVLGRVFMFCENTYLTEDYFTNSSSTSYELKQTKKALNKEESAVYEELLNNYKINYVSEITSLLDSIDMIYELYQNVYDPNSELEILDMIFNAFDESNPKYSRNNQLFDSLLDVICSSQLLGKVLGTSLILSSIESSLTDIVTNYEIPKNISFANSYDDNGKLLSYGETYNILCGLRELARKENKSIIDSLTTQDEVSFETLVTLSKSINNVNEKGESIASYLVNSKILNSFVTTLLMDNNGSDETIIYIPKAALEKYNDQYTNYVKVSYFKEILVNLPDIIELISPIVNDPDNIDSIGNLINSPLVLKLIYNPIIQGTFANQIVKMSDGSDFFVISAKLNDIENWVSIEDTEGEIFKLIHCIQLLNIDLSKLDSIADDPSSLFETINQLKEEDIEYIFNSEVLHYSISSFLLNDNFDNFTILIPAESIKSGIKDDAVENLIYKSELVDFFKNCIKLNLINLIEGDDFSKLLNALIEYKDDMFSSNMTSATLIYNVYGYLPEDILSNDLIEAANELKNNASNYTYKYRDNLWYSEFKNFLSALDDIFAISSEKNEVNINDEGFEDEITNKVLDIFGNSYDDESKAVSGKTRLEVCYSSIIIKNSITQIIDKAFLESYTYDDGKQSEIITNSKENGYYKLEEIHSICDLAHSYGIDLNGIDDLAEMDLSKYEIIISDNIIRDIKESYIVRALLSAAIYSVCDEEGSILVSHPLSWDLTIDTFIGDADKRKVIFRPCEIISILKIAANININDLNPSSLNLSSYIDMLNNEYGECDSYIMCATISSYIINSNTFVIPKNTLDSYSSSKGIETIIDSKQLYYLLKSLDSMGIFDSNDVELENITLDNIKITSQCTEYLSLSKILNATVIKNLKINDSNDLYVESKTQYSSREENRNGEEIIVLSDQEFNNLIEALLVVNPSGTLNFELNVYRVYLFYVDNKIDVLCNSSVLSIYITYMIDSNYGTYVTMMGITPDIVNCYNILTLERNDSVKKYNKVDMGTILNTLATSGVIGIIN